MAEFSRLVITNKGQALLAKMMTGEGNVEFTKISTSDMEYTLEQLEALTEFSGVKQTVSVSKVTRTNGVAVTIEATFDNTELTQGYHMRALGLYAIDPDDGEILYAVTAEVSGCCYMPAYNGVTVSGACIKLVTTVGNAENVSLEVDPGVYATVGEIKELRESVDGIETWKDNTQKRLDNWGPTIVGHGQVINNNKDKIAALDARAQAAENRISALEKVDEGNTDTFEELRNEQTEQDSRIEANANEITALENRLTAAEQSIDNTTQPKAKVKYLKLTIIPDRKEYGTDENASQVLYMDTHTKQSYITLTQSTVDYILLGVPGDSTPALYIEGELDLDGYAGTVDLKGTIIMASSSTSGVAVKNITNTLQPSPNGVRKFYNNISVPKRLQEDSIYCAAIITIEVK